jgi:hypothetical protein
MLKAEIEADAVETQGVFQEELGFEACIIDIMRLESR